MNSKSRYKCYKTSTFLWKNVLANIFFLSWRKLLMNFLLQTFEYGCIREQLSRCVLKICKTTQRTLKIVAKLLIKIPVMWFMFSKVTYLLTLVTLLKIKSIVDTSNVYFLEIFCILLQKKVLQMVCVSFYVLHHYG